MIFFLDNSLVAADGIDRNREQHSNQDKAHRRLNTKCWRKSLKAFAVELPCSQEKNLLMVEKTSSLYIQREPPENFFKPKRTTLCNIQNIIQPIYLKGEQLDRSFVCSGFVLVFLFYPVQKQHGEQKIYFISTLPQHSPSTK